MRITIDFDDEFSETIKRESIKNGISLSEFIKRCVQRCINDGIVFKEVENYVDDETIQKILEESLDKLPSKKKFLLQELFGLDWRDLTNGQRQRLGKYFYRAVINGQYPNVKFIGKKSAYGGKAMYEKI